MIVATPQPSSNMPLTNMPSAANMPSANMRLASMRLASITNRQRDTGKKSDLPNMAVSEFIDVISYGRIHLRKGEPGLGRESILYSIPVATAGRALIIDCNNASTMKTQISE